MVTIIRVICLDARESILTMACLLTLTLRLYLTFLLSIYPYMTPTDTAVINWLHPVETPAHNMIKTCYL